MNGENRLLAEYEKTYYTVQWKTEDGNWGMWSQDHTDLDSAIDSTKGEKAQTMTLRILCVERKTTTSEVEW